MHNIGYISEPENVKRDWVLSKIVEEACRDGDGYSGPLKWHDEIPVQENRDAAEAKIKQLDKGWYDDHAVRYYDYSSAKPTAKMDEIRQRIAKINDQKMKFVEKTSVKKFKADYIGCRECGSKLRRNKLRSEHCPLCGKDLRANSTIEKIKDYDKKINDGWESFEAEKKKQKSARKVMWLIKYEYHS